MKKVLMFSGGMDSYIGRELLNPDVLLYVDTGNRYSVKEKMNLERIRKEQKEDRIVIEKAEFLGKFEQPNGYIPLRNLFFAEIGTLYGDTVYMGALKGETSRDKSGKFRKQTTELTNYLWHDLMLTKKKDVKVEFPFEKMTKTQLLKKYLDKGYSAEDLKKYSISCYDTEKLRCGDCPSCFRRWVAEELNGLNTTDDYDKPPYLFGRKLTKDVKTIGKGILDYNTWRTMPENIEALKAMRRYQ
jgi:7-cyano-7-deazaguanine synthase in queuosine biosynthesis